MLMSTLRGLLPLGLNVTPEDAGAHATLLPGMLCAFRSGVREGELIALKPKDIDFNGRFIEVRRTFYRGRITPPR
jgi:integrase